MSSFLHANSGLDWVFSYSVVETKGFDVLSY